MSDQLYGSDRHHRQIREEVVQYMVANEGDFAPFMVDDETFEEHSEFQKCHRRSD